MSKDKKKELTNEQIKKQAINKMLEALISGNSEEASSQLHAYLQIKTSEVIMGEGMSGEYEEEADKKKKSKKKDDEDDDDDDDDDDDEDCDDDKKEKVDEQDRSSAFSNSGTVMDDKIKGKIKYENGGKKTLKKHGNSAKGLDDDKIDKTKFKSGGKQPARTLEKTPKPAKFNDGRDKELGTTKS